MLFRSGKTYNRFSEISAIVREMNDDEAFDAMITENLQRKDVDPIEEAFAFGQLIQKGKSAEEVAARFGKSIRFVQDRIKLNSLIPELMKEVKEDNMPISAAMVISKVDEASISFSFCSNRTDSRASRLCDSRNMAAAIFSLISRSLARR